MLCNAILTGALSAAIQLTLVLYRQ
uniref:Uncharacterized protein n=1 Tax=Triticum urartu TaxID=4572 RepID=A0A8R7U8G8_TRIUA